MKRAQMTSILQDLDKKIGLIVGPRQVGKTYLAREITKSFTHPLYLNYDHIADRELIHSQNWLSKTDLLVLDELHKMPEWKNYLKGLYDTKPPHLRILVTGSARLEIFTRMGDSLPGRYFLHRLLPLSLAELRRTDSSLDLDRLMVRGGFPEAYFAEDDIAVDRWRVQYVDSILSTDVFDFNMIQNMRALRLVFDLLRSKVGSPVSYQSLAEDVAVSPNTVKKYIEILESLFVIFRVTPYAKNIARSLLKEPKIYFFDNGLVKGGEGPALENLVAVSLLKHVYGRVDYMGEPMTLHYLRTKDQVEVDFALVKDGQVQEMVEVKYRDDNVSPGLRAFHTKYGFNAIQVVHTLKHERIVDGVSIMRAENFLKELFL